MLQFISLFAVSILTTATAQLFFKKGVLRLGELNFSLPAALSLIAQIFQNVWILMGVFLFGISFLLWLFILSKLQLNVAYPIALSCELTLASIGSWFLFKEYLSIPQIGGIILILVGIFLLSTRG